MPPTTFGVVFVVQSVRPGSTRSGEKARWKSAPASRPLPRSRIGRSTSRVVPGIGRRLEHDEVALAQVRRDARARADSIDERSGSRCRESGVGSGDQDRVGVAEPS